MDEQQVLIRILESGWAQCVDIVRADGGVLFTALVAGLVGSATHCVGMCGPFVISQVTSRMEQLPVEKMSEFRRLTGAALLPYQFGRLSTYCLLGVLAGYFTDSISALTRIWWLGPVLLLAAGLFFLLFGILGLMPHLGGLLPSTGESRWWNKLVGNHARGLFAADFSGRFGYGLQVRFRLPAFGYARQRAGPRSRVGWRGAGADPAARPVSDAQERRAVFQDRSYSS